MKFKLTADLDFTDITFDGIGTATTAFKGNFIGDAQYSINNLSNCVFNYIDDGANISGLKVYNSYIEKSCGIIVDNMLGGTISDCTVKGGGIFTFDSGSYAGGIVGNGTGGSVTNCNVLKLGLFATNKGVIVGNGSTSVSGCKFAYVGADNIGGNPIDGTNIQYFVLNKPNGVTATCTNAENNEVTIDGDKFYTSGATFNVTVDLETSDYVKITTFNGESYTGDTYTLTLTGDTSINLGGYPKIGNIHFNADENYYEISSDDDLQALASYVNSYGTTSGYTFKQTADIDLGTIENFTPIGDYANYCSFEGTFDGCGYKISNLKIDSSSNKVGLFGDVDGGTIQNVNLVNATVKGDSATYAGALVGMLSGKVENCSIGGNISVSGQNNVGGLVGGLNTNSTIDKVLIDGANLSVSSQTNLNKTGGTVLGYIYNNQSYTVQNIYYHNFTSDIESVYGKNITATTVYALNLPKNVTASGALEFGGKYYAQSGATITISGFNGGEITFDDAITSLTKSGDNIIAHIGDDLSFTISGIALTGETSGVMWSYSDGIGTYGQQIPASGYIDGTTIKYRAGSIENAQVQLSGITNPDGLEVWNNFVNIEASVVGDNGASILSNAGNYIVTLFDDWQGKTFTGTDDADNIQTNGNATNVSVDAGAGDDEISNTASFVTINGGAGDDYIYNFGDNVTINGGAGNDTINNNGSNNSINGGLGNDEIFLAGKTGNTINTADGDDTIKIDTTNTVNDFTVENFGVGDVIQFIGYEDNPDFDNSKPFSEDNPPQIQVIVPVNSLTTTEGGIIADGVTISGINSLATAQKGWATAESGFAYQSWNTSGATLDGGTIIYAAETAKTNDFIISGMKDGLTVEQVSAAIDIDGTQITIKDGAIFDTCKKITAPSGYTLKITDTSGHYASDSGDGYTLATNTDDYSNLIRVYALTLPDGVEVTSGIYATTGGKTYAAGEVTINSTEDIKGLTRDGSGNYTVNIESDVAFELVIITALTLTDANASAMTLAADVGTVDGSARTKAIKIVGNELNNSIVGGSGNDTLDGSTGDDTLTGNAGNDTFIYSGGKDIITDYGVGTDKISITSEYQSYSIDGNDLIFNFGENNSLTVKNAANIPITLNGASKKFTAEGVMTGTGTAITLNSDVPTYTADEAVVTINASATNGATVIGNVKSNRFYGSSGADTFVYEHTEQEKISYTSVEGGGVEEVVSTIYSAGSDVIYNYGAGDKISLASGVELKDAYKQNDDVVVKVDSGTITVKDSADKSIKFVQGEEEITFNGDVFSKANTSILPATFDAEVTLGATTKNLDASKLTGATKLNGNDSANSIVGGKSSDTLDGGAGDDSLTGGAGSDVFVYSGGKDVITDYGTGTDKIITASNYESYTFDGNDIIFNFGGENSLTVKNGVGKSLNINGVAKNFSDKAIYNSNNTAVTLEATTTPFDATEFENLVTIDGSAVTSGLEVVSNAKANKIYAGKNGSTLDGGSGNDTLIGGAGADKFVYGVGNDVIDNYGAGDKISLASGVTITDFYKTNADLYIKFSAGSLTVKNTSSVTFEQDGKEFVYSEGKLVDGDSVTLPATFSNEITLDSGIKNLNASKLTGATKLNGNDSANSIVGGKSSDTLDGGLGDDTLTGGEGNDTFIYNSGKDIITDYGNGTDKIVTASDYESYTFDGEDIIFNFGGENSLTVKNGVGKSLNINGVAKNFSADKTFNSNNTAVTLGATTTPFDATEFENLVTIDGSAVTSTLKVVGNDKSNRIYAGKGGSTLNGGLGSDYLYGGAGSDVFVYEHHDQEKTTYTAEGASVSTIYTSGSDVIYNYEEGDKISLGADVVLKDAYKQNDDTIIKVDNGTITVKNSADKSITLVQGEEEFTFSGGVFVSGDNVSIPATFDNKFTLDTEKTNLDASMRSSAIKLSGNDKNNSIVGGKSSDTLDGGLGDDTLTGGAGSDVFVYSGGNDTITDYGTGSDKISIASGFTRESSVVSGNDIIWNFGEGNSLTLKDFAGKKVTLASASTSSSTDTTKYNSKKTSVTLAASVESYAAEDSIVTINAAATNGVSITGNAKSNRVYFGEGSDTFVYEHHDQEKITYTAEGSSVSTIYTSGSDVIYNYEESDKISLASGVELKNAYKKNADTIINVDSGTITVKDSANKAITLVQDGEEITFSGDIFSKPDTSILPATFTNDVTLDSGTNNLDATKRTAATKLTGNELNNSIVGGTKNDTIDGGNGNDKLFGNGGADLFVYGSGNDTIMDYGNGSDKISLASDFTSYEISGNDIIFNFDGENSLKVQNGVEKSLNINGVAKNFAAEGVSNSKNTAITLKSDATTYTADADIVTIDGSQTNGVTVTGNIKNNRFYAGSGADVFVYEHNEYTVEKVTAEGVIEKNLHGSGSDIIYNYGDGDKISLGADVVLKNGYMKNADFVCRVDDGYITVKNASTVAFTQGDKDFEFNGEFFVSGDSVSIPATFVGEYNLDENAKNLNATMRTSAIKLVGNEKDNSIVGGTKNDKIYGGAGADSLWGGKGNDTLYGGDGADTFIFQSGDGKDTIFDFESDDMLKILDANGNAGTFSKASYGSGTLTLTVADSGGTIYLKNLTTETNININGEIYHVSGKTLTK